MTDQMFTINKVCSTGCNKEGDCPSCSYKEIIHDTKITETNVGSGLFIEGYLALATEDPANMNPEEIEILKQG